MMRCAFWSGVFLCAFAVKSLHAQQMEVGAQQNSIGGNQSIMVAILQPVTGAPYQAEKVTRSVQKLGDGTVITHESKGLIARDTQGRMREDLYIVQSGQMNGRERDMSLQSATVGDPVAHTMLIWTGEKTKIAMQMQLPSLPKGAMGSMATAHTGMLNLPIVGSIAPLGSAHIVPDDVHTEDLGQQSIEGLLVTGKRTTTTIPLGKIGNDRPIVMVHEEWRSPELNILVKTVDNDPRTGEQTMELQGLARTDPDAALFEAPAGYKVQDMAQLLKGFGDIGKGK
jgi:hypothetical protein